MPADIHKAGLILIRNGALLLCRKRKDAQTLILPGGKIEPGESPLQALQREIAEELSGAKIADPKFLGSYFHPAQENFRSIQLELFSATLPEHLTPSSEIAELAWFAPDDDGTQLAPSLRTTILPALRQLRLL